MRILNRYLLATLFVSCTTTIAYGEDITVEEYQNAFTPDRITIKQGDTVTFKSADTEDTSREVYIVNTKRQVYEKTAQKTAESPKFIFAKAGTYEVHDGVDSYTRATVLVTPAPRESAHATTGELSSLSPAAGGDAVVVK